MKVCLIQMNSGADKAVNLAQAQSLIEQVIVLEKPDWIGLPEVFDFLGGSLDQKRAAAEELPGGAAYRCLSELAARHGVFIHGGSILEKVQGDERMYNTTLVFNRAGREIARYRKIHLFDVVTPDGKAYRESASFLSGDSLVTYECEGITFGCAICFDLRFPQLFSALVAKGAQCIVLPAAFTLMTGKDHWEVLLRARAIETQCYVCAPGQSGAYQQGAETRHNYGHSLVADPWGHVIAKASDGVGWVCARIEPARLDTIRQAMPLQAKAL